MVSFVVGERTFDPLLMVVMARRALLRLKARFFIAVSGVWVIVGLDLVWKVDRT